MDNNCQLVLVQTVWVALKNHHFSTSCIANLCNQIMLDSGQKWKELFHTWDTGPFSTEYTFHIPSVIIYSSICSSSSAWNPSIFSPCTYPLESVQGTCYYDWDTHVSDGWYTCMCCVEYQTYKRTTEISTCDYILLVVNFCRNFFSAFSVYPTCWENHFCYYDVIYDVILLVVLN